MKYLFFTTLVLSSFQLFAQCDGRYEEEIFSEVSKTIIEYTDVYDWSVIDTGLEMDVYQAVGDTATNRPLIVFAHGGAYIAGNKNNPAMITLCEAFARRGYVTASIQYRLTSSANLISPNASSIFTQTVLNSVSDMKAAVRYFRKDVEENNNFFGINPDLIFAGGYSAGAVTSAHLSMIDEDQVPDAFQSFFDEAGGIEGNSGNPGYSSEVSGAILLAGAINTTDYIDVDDVPTVSVHAVDDNTVNYECANALGYSNLPYLCGSGEIHEKLESLGVENELYTFQSGGHTAPVLNLDNIVVPFISEFLYDLICVTTSVNEVPKNSFDIYPNPCLNILNIENIDADNNEVIVSNLLGQVLMQFELVKGTNRLSVSHLKKGAYLITTNKPNSNKQLFVKN
jgi:para-nitrobenzyl esterase